ncbi:MAG TPA: ATP-binding protein [Amycolatopsis sp.]|uniref:ATP-binding protein n=1 Tax=Amycolatopsis sp. TaxID=37632 RepID=UPI002B46999B|nr:ATP-binding protein [Amycolatopsis sp.]HKS47361.1 ATP-binding protein [Amycolatopsis sp.]
MIDSEPPDLHTPGDLGLEDIELRLAADLVNLPIVRSVVATIATRADFDLDAIADLRLAVDEACSTLITRAVPGTVMHCRFTVSGDSLCFVGTVRSETGAEPSTKSFGWRVLTTLTDSVHSRISSNGQFHRLDIELAKRRVVVEVPGAGA